MKLGLIIETIDLTEEEETGDEKRVTQISREGGGWENMAPDPCKERRSLSLSTKLPKWRNPAAVSGLSTSSGTQKLPPTLLSPSSSTRARRDMTIIPPPTTTTAMPGTMGMRAVSGSYVPRQSSVSTTTAWSTSGPNRKKRRRASISVAAGSISTGIKRGSASLRDNVHYWVSSAVGSGGDHRYQRIS